MTAAAVNLSKKLSTFSEYWSPNIVAQFNGHDVMVVKVNGEFVWNSHDETDDFFLVLSGIVAIETEPGNVILKPGELYVVPKGVQHWPVAQGEAHILLIEPKGTPNTGDARTVARKVEI